MQIIVVLIAFTIFTTIVSGSSTKTAVATKKSSAIAVPKSKGSKKAWKSFGFGIIGKMVREAKVAFCSELEALVLQMTRPDDSATLTTNFAMLSTCINQDFEDAEFVTSVITKLSRKFNEENVFTKFKSLLCLHAVLQKLNDDAQSSVCHCVDTLKTEEDVKYNQNYFLNGISSKLANNVAELETVAVLKEYYPYLFYFIELKQQSSDSSSATDFSSSSSSTDKISKNKSTNIINTENKIKSLCKLLNLGDDVTEACKGATSCNNSPLFKQFLDIMMTDREAAIKQLQKICDTKANQALTVSETSIQTLTAHGIDVDTSSWSIVSSDSDNTHHDKKKITTGLNKSSSSSSSSKGDKNDAKNNKGNHASSGSNTNTKATTNEKKSGSTKPLSSSTSSPSAASAAAKSKSNSQSHNIESIGKPHSSKVKAKVQNDDDDDDDEMSSTNRVKMNLKTAITNNKNNNNDNSENKAVKSMKATSKMPSSSSSSSRPATTTATTSSNNSIAKASIPSSTSSSISSSSKAAATTSAKPMNARTTNTPNTNSNKKENGGSSSSSNAQKKSKKSISKSNTSGSSNSSNATSKKKSQSSKK